MIFSVLHRTNCCGLSLQRDIDFAAGLERHILDLVRPGNLSGNSLPYPFVDFGCCKISTVGTDELGTVDGLDIGRQEARLHVSIVPEGLGKLGNGIGKFFNGIVLGEKDGEFLAISCRLEKGIFPIDGLIIHRSGDSEEIPDGRGLVLLGIVEGFQRETIAHAVGEDVEGACGGGELQEEIFEQRRTGEGIFFGLKILDEVGVAGPSIPEVGVIEIAHAFHDREIVPEDIALRIIKSVDEEHDFFSGEGGEEGRFLLV